MAAIMVAADEHQWTLDAMHLACALARNSGKDIVLVKLVFAEQAAYLGSHFAQWNYTAEEQAQIRDCTHTAEDYGVNVSLMVFEYIDTVPALVQAAEHA